MTGKDCDIIPEWWETPRVEMQRANRSYARDIVTHHQALHPNRGCPRLIAAVSRIADVDKQVSS